MLPMSNAKKYLSEIRTNINKKFTFFMYTNAILEINNNKKLPVVILSLRTSYRNMLVVTGGGYSDWQDWQRAAGVSINMTEYHFFSA